MKTLIKTLSTLAVAALLSTSCSEDTDNTGDSNINFSPATVTLSSPSPNVFDESAIDADVPSTYQILIEATLDAPQPVNAVIDIVQTGGSADSNDFETGTITILAGDLTGSTSINILQTGDIEGTETLQLTGKSVSNFNVSPFTYSGTIEGDYINNQLDLTLSWDGSAVSGDLSITSFCDMDFDLILYDSAFDYVGYVLGSTACPEHDLLGGLADGTYYLVTDLWANPYSGIGLTDEVPLTLTWSQEYFPEIAGSISSSSYNLSSPDTASSGAGLGGMIVVLEVANGYEYTLSPF